MPKPIGLAETGQLASRILKAIRTRSRVPVRVKMRNAHREHFGTVRPRKADVVGRGRLVGFVTEAVVPLLTRSLDAPAQKSLRLIVPPPPTKPTISEHVYTPGFLIWAPQSGEYLVMPARKEGD
jgi:hypothetical protein